MEAVLVFVMVRGKIFGCSVGREIVSCFHKKKAMTFVLQIYIDGGLKYQLLLEKIILNIHNFLL